MNMLLNRFRRRAHLAEELVDEALHDHDAAMEAYGAEESVGECLQMNELLRHAWKTTYDHLFDGKIEDVDGYYTAIVDSVDRTINTATRAQQMAKRSIDKGFEVKRFGEIDKMISELKEMRLEIDRVWPKIDYQLVSESRAACERGELISIEDLLREAQLGTFGADQ